MKTKVAVITKHFHTTGISSVIVNYCTYINLQKFDVTIFVGPPINTSYVEQCQSKGIHVEILPAKGFYKTLKAKLETTQYDVAHIHGSSSLIYPEAEIAKSCHIKNIILHSHSTSSTHKIIHNALKTPLNHIATNRVSCATNAGKWMYGKKSFSVIPNGIHLQKYTFNDQARSKIRHFLKLSKNDFIIGHIGRFNENKNQKFLINLLPAILEKCSNTYLALVGDGATKKELIQYANSTKYKNHIFFINETESPEEYYSCFDLFAMPSTHEGMPVVLIEAQANGLDCILSDSISRETNLTKTSTFISLQNVRSWADTITEYIKNYNIRNRHQKSEIAVNKLQMLGYDIARNANILENIYLSNKEQYGKD